MDRVHTWQEFKDEVASLRSVAMPEPVLFRGQASTDWQLATTLERFTSSKSIGRYYQFILRIRPEIETSTGLSWEQGLNRVQIEKQLKDYEPFDGDIRNMPHYAYMVYLRHHGFPSPLLDWSRSPFVAAYFAFREPAAPYVKIFAYREMTHAFKVLSSDEAQINSFGPYIRGPKRHFAQQSQYTMCTRFDAEQGWKFAPHAEVLDRGSLKQDVIQQFYLSASDRPLVLRELSDYNLTAFSLFGSEDGLMEALKIREESFLANGDEPRIRAHTFAPTIEVSSDGQ